MKGHINWKKYKQEKKKTHGIVTWEDAIGKSKSSTTKINYIVWNKYCNP
jgi:hypothetical protein